MVNISIITDNAAFHGEHGAKDQYHSREETARILRRLAEQISAGEAIYPDLFDYNGNKVGKIVLTGRERSWL